MINCGKCTLLLSENPRAKHNFIVVKSGFQFIHIHQALCFQGSSDRSPSMHSIHKTVFKEGDEKQHLSQSK